MTMPRVLLVFLMLTVLSATSAMAGEGTLIHNGVERRYIIREPQIAALDLKVPAIIVLHGGGGNAESAERMTGFTELAVPHGCIVVYPEGTSRFSRMRGLKTWNARHCCGYAMKQDVDDVGFISALIDRLVAENHADPRRIYVTGMSNGAMMTHRLGIELSGKIAAIGPVVGGLFGDEPIPPHPVSAMIVNGARDKSIPLHGGQTGSRFPDAWDGTPLKPAAYQGEFWARANGCGQATDSATAGGAVLVRTYACPQGRDVVQYLVQKGGHAWPGGQKGSRRGDTPSKALNATEVLFTFFMEHGRS
ncbi:alpha/beta hydrolase family esterase [Oceanidesulfovibrio marinus]|uniref:Polyhydroxybutyrate depolymerase n=1 Tax=Oceanidesulfovibrio marinus TaxID=370038 RepID=A0A6P1ZJZ2_9BACT|nr:PHB depolymerase family esterase [Oceanidesulfovibrio marinus]TVM36031.1 polyhydroxybutyrate depolymerase [Oceanidesulfovibrio marinus]